MNLTCQPLQLDTMEGIQKLHSRDNDLLVLQEEKASKVMYGKDALYNGDGTLNVTSIQQVLALSKCIWEKTE
jgi:hypothetical protein